MKSNTSTITRGIAALFWSVFIGITVIAIGAGAVYPPLNQVAAPFVCPQGQMHFQETTTKPLPDTTYTLIGWSCVDQQTGAETKLEMFPMTLYSGTLYGLILFVIVAIIGYFRSRRSVSPGLAAHAGTIDENSAATADK